jgi:hypothetical protein
MAKDSKIGNLLKFEEYDHLQPKQTPTKKTEIGGFAVLEGMSIKEMIKLAAQKSGKSKKELKNLSPKKLKRIIGENKVKTGKPKVKAEKPETEEKEEVKASEETGPKNERFLFEKKKASAKQKAARAKFMEMIGKKKKGKSKEEDDANESLKNLFY